MADVTISLNNIRNVKTLYIEGIGGFTVRKLGAGEELDLSDKMRRLGAILTELQVIDFTKYDVTKKDDLKALEDIRKRAEELTLEVNQIQRFELETYKRCFTADKDPKDVDTLIDQLSVEDRSHLFKTLFDTVKPVEAPETPESPEVQPESTKDVKKDVKPPQEAPKKA
jgi:hypothetical protein